MYRSFYPGAPRDIDEAARKINRASSIGNSRRVFLASSAPRRTNR